MTTDTQEVKLKAAAELAEEVRRLEEELAKERPGMCVYAVGGDARSAPMTELSCALLNGTWIDGTVGSADESAATAKALIAALQRKLDNQDIPPPERGTCVYAAGGRVCRAETMAEQCDLIAGRWFPVPIQETENKNKKEA